MAAVPPLLRPSHPQSVPKAGRRSRLPLRAAVRVLTDLPLLSAKKARGRRTRKPPAGALSKESGDSFLLDSENLTRKELTTETPAHGR